MVSYTYARQGTRYRPIPRATTVRLIRAAQRGGEKGKAAMQMLLEQNLGLVHNIVGRYDTSALPSTIDRNDLVAEGLLGLMHAVRKFDPARGTQFSTYAVWWVRQRIQRFLQKQTTFTTSIQVVTRRERVGRISDRFLSEFGRSPTLAELAALTSLTPAQLDRASTMPDVAFSLDEPDPRGRAGQGGNDTREDHVAAPDLLAPLVAQIDHAELCDYLATVLSPRHWLVLQLHLGLGPADGVALLDIQIGRRLGFSKQRANQLYQEALDKLREPLIARQLIAMLHSDSSPDC